MSNAIQRPAFDPNIIECKQQRGNEMEAGLPSVPAAFYTFRLIGPDFDLEIHPHNLDAAQAIEKHADGRNMLIGDYLKDRVLASLVEGEAVV
jgi:hypothetical protein